MRKIEEIQPERKYLKILGRRISLGTGNVVRKWKKGNYTLSLVRENNYDHLELKKKGREVAFIRAEPQIGGSRFPDEKIISILGNPRNFERFQKLIDRFNERPIYENEINRIASGSLIRKLKKVI